MITAKAAGIHELYKQAMLSPQGNEDKFVAAWANFKQVFGKSVLPDVIKILHGATWLMEQMILLRNTYDGVKKTADKLNTPTLPGMLVHALSPGEALLKFLNPQPSAIVLPTNEKSGKIVHVTNIHLDGEKVATVVTKHQMGSGNLTGTTSMNPTAGRPTPGTPALGY